MYVSLVRWLGPGVATVAAAAAAVVGLGGGFAGGPDDSLPRLLTVRCGADGSSAVSSARVAASKDGLHIKVDRGTASLGATFGYSASSGKAEGRHLFDEPMTYVFDVSPGEMSINCVEPDSDFFQNQLVTVVDPDHYYDDVDTEAVLGCTPIGEGNIDGPTATADTGEEAARAYVDANVDGGTVTLAAGYRGDLARDYLVAAPGEHGGEIDVDATVDGQFNVALRSFC